MGDVAVIRGTGKEPYLHAFRRVRLLPLAVGFRQSKFRPQGREGARERLEGFCQVLEQALAIAHKDLDRLILARELMWRVTAQCRGALPRELTGRTHYRARGIV